MKKVFFSLLLFCLNLEADEKWLDLGFQYYQEGEKAKNLKEREEKFNASLSEYQSLLKVCCPEYGTGKIYYNIANNYFQLNQYPYAILNYYRALKLLPREAKVNHNLNITLEKLGLVDKKPTSLYEHFFFFQNYFSLPERMQIFVMLILCLFFLSSLYIWKRTKRVKNIIKWVGIFTALFFVSLLYTRYLAPIEGVIIKPSFLYRDAGFQYAKVSDEPAIAGKKIKVLEVLEEGKWLKVVTEEGQLGYLPYTHLELI